MKKKDYLWRAVILLALLTVNIVGQDFDIRRAEGKVVAKGTNTTAVKGDGFKLLSYRVEVIYAPSTAVSNTSKINDSTIKGVRLVLTGEFPPAAYIVWINGAGILATNGPKDEIYVHRSGNELLFEEGAEIAVSYYDIKAPRVRLPESLVLPNDLTAPRRSEKELQETVVLNYIPCYGETPGLKSKCISISLLKNPYFNLNSGNLNNALYLQIGTELFSGADNRFYITEKEYEKLEDGAWVVVKNSSLPYGGVSVGRLNKSSLKPDIVLGL